MISRIRTQLTVTCSRSRSSAY